MLISDGVHGLKQRMCHSQIRATFAWQGNRVESLKPTTASLLERISNRLLIHSTQPCCIIILVIPERIPL